MYGPEYWCDMLRFSGSSPNLCSSFLDELQLSNGLLWKAGEENVSGYISKHGSLNRERDIASPIGRYGERLQRDSCLKHTI